MDIYAKLMGVGASIRGVAPEAIAKAAEIFSSMLEDLSVRSPADYKEYLEAPAAKAHHQAYPGGLLEHCFKVAVQLVNVASIKGIDLTAEEAVRIAFMHDMCKLGLYQLVQANADGTYMYTYDKASYAHHAAASITKAEALGYALSAKERIAIVYHMGPWHNAEDPEVLTKDEKALVGTFIDVVLATHNADMNACE